MPLLGSIGSDSKGNYGYDRVTNQNAQNSLRSNLAYCGSGSYNNSTAYDMDVDPNGNIFIGGLAQVSGQATLAVPFNTFGYLSKYDPFGILLWTKTVQSSLVSFQQDRTTIYAVKVGKNTGNIYVTGMIANSTTVRQPYAACFDTNGNILWQRIVNPELTTYPHGMCIDDNENVYMTGQVSISGSANTNYVFIYGWNMNGNARISHYWSASFGVTGTPITGYSIASTPNGSYQMIHGRSSSGNFAVSYGAYTTALDLVAAAGYATYPSTYIQPVYSTLIWNPLGPNFSGQVGCFVLFTGTVGGNSYVAGLDPSNGSTQTYTFNTTFSGAICSGTIVYPNDPGQGNYFYSVGGKTNVPSATNGGWFGDLTSFGTYINANIVTFGAGSNDAQKNYPSVNAMVSSTHKGDALSGGRSNNRVSMALNVYNGASLSDGAKTPSYWYSTNAGVFFAPPTYNTPGGAATNASINQYTPDPNFGTPTNIGTLVIQPTTGAQITAGGSIVNSISGVTWTGLDMGGNVGYAVSYAAWPISSANGLCGFNQWQHVDGF